MSYEQSGSLSAYIEIVVKVSIFQYNLKRESPNSLQNCFSEIPRQGVIGLHPILPVQANVDYEGLCVVFFDGIAVEERIIWLEVRIRHLETGAFIARFGVPSRAFAGLMERIFGLIQYRRLESVRAGHGLVGCHHPSHECGAPLC